MNNSYCETHRYGRGSRVGGPSRISMDRLMHSLPKGQSGAGTHKCAYCAYEHGIEDGRRQEQQRIAKILGLELLESN